MAEPVSSLLKRSLAHLLDEVPDSYRVILDRLGPLVVDLAVDAEHFSLRGGSHLEVRDGPAGGEAGGPGARVTTSRSAIVDLLDARLGLTEAVEAGSVGVLGALEDLLRAHDALLAYVHAAVRAPAQPELLSALRADAS